MTRFATLALPAEPNDKAPDGSEVRVLLRLPGAGMAHFHLAAGSVARAVTHRSVEELWFILAGRGEMWRRQGDREEVDSLVPGLCVSIPLGTHFQFRASPTESVSAIVVTLPPWPGDDEAMVVEGAWQPSGR